MAKTKAKARTKANADAGASAAQLQAHSNKEDAPHAFGHEQIAERAREIWRRKGQPSGLDEQNWLEAIEELRNIDR